MRPLLYPLQNLHYTAALKDFNSTSMKMITQRQALAIWARHIASAVTIQSLSALNNNDNTHIWSHSLLGNPIEVCTANTMLPSYSRQNC